MNTEWYYGGYAMEATWHNRVAQEKGLTMQELLNTEGTIFDLMLDYAFTGSNQVVARFSGGMTMQVDFSLATSTVSSIEMRLDGAPGYLWTGSMSFDEFAADEWPASVSHGSSLADFLYVDAGMTTYGYAGNDVIEISGGVVYGGADMDTFVVEGGYGNMTIRDYQAGEKIVFANFDSLGQLAAQVTGVSQAAGGGFHVDFGVPYGPNWSMTFENFSLDALRVEDILVGLTGLRTAYAPLAQAFGVDVADML